MTSFNLVHDATRLLVQTLKQQNMQVLVLMFFWDFLLVTLCNSGHELSQCRECFETHGEHQHQGTSRQDQA